MIKYKDNFKYAFVDNIKFTRDEKTNYFLSSTKINGKKYRLHRYIYEKYNGKIPDGFQIHHKDFNKLNNDIENLVLIKRGIHQKLHGDNSKNNKKWLEWSRNNLKENARPKAIKWHKSKSGIEWHKKHYEELKHKLHKKINKNCANCNKEFITIDNNKSKFCSNKCKSAHRKKSGIDNEKRTCEMCGKEFECDKYSKTKTCSQSCSNRLFPRLPQLRKN